MSSTADQVIKKVTFGFDEQISTREDISGIKRPKNLNF